MKKNITHTPEDRKDYPGHFDDGNHPGGSDIYEALTKKPKHLTYKVDETMLKRWRQKETVNAFVNGQEKKIQILKGEIQWQYPKAYVRKYIDEPENSIPKHLIGEQVFNRNAILNLGIENQLPTWEKVIELRGKNHKSFVKKNFEKDGKMNFPGVYEPKDNEFDDIGAWIDIWLSDGSAAGIDEKSIDHNTVEGEQMDPEYGSSIILWEDLKKAA